MRDGMRDFIAIVVYPYSTRPAEDSRCRCDRCEEGRLDAYYDAEARGCDVSGLEPPSNECTCMACSDSRWTKKETEYDERQARGNDV